MNRLPISMLAIVALGCAGSASTKVTDPRVSATLACTPIADSVARLACYDAAADKLKEAVDSGTLVAEKKIGDPSGLEGVVKSSRERGFMRFGVVLDNGDRWELVADSQADTPPRAGVKVQLRKSLGGYWMKEPGGPDRKARFLGRSKI